MLSFPRSLQRLVQELCKLPSIGEKSAARLAYFLVTRDRKIGLAIADAIQQALNNTKLCGRCFNLTEDPICEVCQKGDRNSTLLCVVEKPIDVSLIERVGEFKGHYHVLHGLWAPLRGQGPESMKLNELMQRIRAGGVQEVILALSSTVEGDATALYIAKLLQGLGVRTSRLAQGLPKGGELEYADDVTLSRAFSGRNVVNT